MIKTVVKTSGLIKPKVIESTAGTTIYEDETDTTTITTIYFLGIKIKEDIKIGNLKVELDSTDKDSKVGF